MKKYLRLSIPILTALVLVLLNTIPVAALTTADVTVTATPEWLSLTNTEDTWEIGAIAESTTVWWSNDGGAPEEPAIDADGKSIATNEGSVASNISIHTHDPQGGVDWTLATSVGEDTVVNGFYKTGDANKAAMGKLVDTTPQELAHALTAVTGHVHWGMYLDTGTFTDGVEKEWTITLTISKHT